MPHLSIIEALALITVLTAAAFYLCTLLRQSTIVGFMIVGILLGPSVFNIFPDQEVVHEFAEVGILIFLFVLGLDTHIKTVKDIVATTLGLAVLQISVCIAATMAVFMWTGLTWQTSLVVGILVSFSSTALVMASYEENNMLTSPSGKIALGILVFQDIFAVLAVGALPLLTAVEEGVRSLVIQLIELIVFIPLFFFIIRRYFPKLMRGAALVKRREFLFLATIAVCLLASAVTEVLGAGAVLGAFIAGLVLSDTIVVHQLHAQLHTLRHLLLGIFFITVGLLLDLSILWENISYVALGLVVLMLFKLAVFYFLIRMYKYKHNIAYSTALAMCQVGEFSFVVAEAALPLNLIPEAIYQSILAIALFSMLLTPAIISRSMRKILSVKMVREVEKGIYQGSPLEEEGKPYAIVVGYGAIGRSLVKVLEDFNIEPRIIDLNLKTIEKLRREGKWSIYGDASQPEVLKEAGLQGARYLLVTPPDLASRISILAASATTSPGVKVITRAHYIAEKSMLEECQAFGMVYEELEVAVGLVAMLLRDLGATEDLVMQEIERVKLEV